MKKLSIITLKKDGIITDFAEARNRELARADAEWVFFVDSDETVTDKLQREIESVIDRTDCVAYTVRRTDTFLGRSLLHGENGSLRLVRLARKGVGKWKRPVHEVWEVNGRIGELHEPLLHEPHTSVSGFLDKINRYSSLEAQYRFRLGIHPTLVHIALFPAAKWVKNYLFLQGFRDGTPGMIMAVMMSLHSFLTWTKLYLLWHEKK